MFEPILMIIGESVSVEPIQFLVGKTFRFCLELEPTLGKWPFAQSEVGGESTPHLSVF
jgi:hypothetical protein